MTGGHRGQQPRRYEIRVSGRLGETIRSAFPALQARTQGEDTVLAGVLADQSALYGVLAECEALGLELLDVRCPDQRSDHHDAARRLAGPARPGGPRINLRCSTAQRTD